MTDEHLRFVVEELLFESTANPTGKRSDDLRRELITLAIAGADLTPHAEALLRVLPEFDDWRQGIDVVRALAYHCYRSGDVQTTKAVFELDELLQWSFLLLDLREPHHEEVVKLCLDRVTEQSSHTQFKSLSLVRRTLDHSSAPEFLVERIPWLVGYLDKKPEGRGHERFDIAWAAADVLFRFLSVDALNGATKSTLESLVERSRANGAPKATQDRARAILLRWAVTNGDWNRAEELISVKGPSLERATLLLVHAVSQRHFDEKHQKSSLVDLETFTNRIRSLLEEIEPRGSKKTKALCKGGLEKLELFA